MFDVGFWELIIISVVALLVVGPEKMPALVREGGKWFATVRRFVMQTKQEIERELNLEAEKDLTAKISDLDTLMEFAEDRDKKTDPEQQQD